MPMRPNRRATQLGVALVSWLGVAGCASSIALEDLAEATADAWCDQLVRCGVFESRDQCDTLDGTLAPNLPAGVAGGTIDYDGEAAADCVDDIASMDCDPSHRDKRLLPASCAPAFTGTLAEGDSCVVDEQCVSGVCVRGGCNMACCVGVCAEPAPARAAIGEECVEVACVDSAWCSDGVCVELSSEGTECEDNAECEFGLACYSMSDATPTCRSLPGEGDACPTDNVTPCDSLRLSCNPATEICEELLYEGDDCVPEAARCSRAYLYCNPDTRTCSLYPELGEECPLYLCSGEAYCDFNWRTLTGTCEAFKADDDRCVLGFECESGYCTRDERCAIEPICL